MKHRVYIRYREGWPLAVCVCGWESAQFVGAEGARRAGERHVDLQPRGIA